MIFGGFQSSTDFKFLKNIFYLFELKPRISHEIIVSYVVYGFHNL